MDLLNKEFATLTGGFGENDDNSAKKDFVTGSEQSHDTTSHTNAQADLLAAQPPLTLPLSPATATDVYWNEQNEDTFLQNLFANTLLSDDFGKETDFDCLGLNNLQLNYTNLSLEPSGAQTSLGNVQCHDNNNSNNNHLANQINSGTLCEQSVSLTASVANTTMAELRTFTNEIDSERQDVAIIRNEQSSLNSITSGTKVSANADDNNNNNKDDYDDDKLFKKPASHVSVYVYSDESASASVSAAHFANGKASRSNSYYSATESSNRESSNEQKQIINLMESIDLMSSNARNADKQKQHQQQQQHALLQHSKSARTQRQMLAELISSPLGVNEHECAGSHTLSTPSSSLTSKLFTLKRSRKRVKQVNTSQQQSPLGETMPTASGVICAETTVVPAPQNVPFNLSSKLKANKQTRQLGATILQLSKANSKKQDKKEKLIKQIKKNNTMLANVAASSAGCSVVAALSSNHDAHQQATALTLRGGTANASACSPLPTLCNSKNSASSATAAASFGNFEPMSKKFAVSKEQSDESINPFNQSVVSSSQKEAPFTTPLPPLPLAPPAAARGNSLLGSNSSLQLKRPDEVDLHIRELSLLDLHSSEDDSASTADFMFKQTGHKLHVKKNTRSSSNDNHIVHPPPTLPPPHQSVAAASTSQLGCCASNVDQQLFSKHAGTANNYLNKLITKRIKYSNAAAVTSSSVLSIAPISRCESNVPLSAAPRLSLDASFGGGGGGEGDYVATILNSDVNADPSSSASSSSSSSSSASNKTNVQQSTGSSQNAAEAAFSSSDNFDVNKEKRLNKLIFYLAKSFDSSAKFDDIAVLPAFSGNNNNNNNKGNSNSNLPVRLTKNSRDKSSSSRKGGGGGADGSAARITSSEESLWIQNSANAASAHFRTPTLASFGDLSSNNCKSKNKRKKNDLSHAADLQTQCSRSCVTHKSDSDIFFEPKTSTLSMMVPPVKQTVAAVSLESSNKKQLSSSVDSETLQHMKNLDINIGNDLFSLANSCSAARENPRDPDSEYNAAAASVHAASSKQKCSSVDAESAESSSSSSSAAATAAASSLVDFNLKLNINDRQSRTYLWNLLKTHSTTDELKYHFGSALHDKLSFWDLVQMKLKYTQSNQLKTTYDIIDDYTLLYSNMSTLLEGIVKEHSSTANESATPLKKNENSSRSRSTSKNCRKQSTSSKSNIGNK